MEELVIQLMAVILVALRIAPTFAFAQPFTLLRIPLTIRLLLSLSLSLWIVSIRPELTFGQINNDSSFLSLAIGELFIGGVFALSLQLAFAAIYWVGGALDIQAGFGLAAVTDPTTQARNPLAGTILAYTGAAIFLGMGAQYDLLALWVATIDELPIGYGQSTINTLELLEYVGVVFSIAMGLIGVIMMVLFLIDMSIAVMSRTLPQMNVLLLGFQVKSMAMLVTLPIAIGVSAAIFVRLIRISLETIPKLISMI